MTKMLKELEYRGVGREFFNVDLTNVPSFCPHGYKDAAVELLSLIREPRMIALVGPTGVGKTALAAGCMRAFYCAEIDACAPLSAPPIWLLSAWDLQNQLRTAPWDRLQKVQDRYRRARLLILDEMQRRDKRDFEEERIYSVLDSRYSNRLATIIISNLQPLALSESLGEPLTRRITHRGGSFINCQWPRIEPPKARETKSFVPF